MRRYSLALSALVVMLLGGMALNSGLTRGAAQATNTPEPIVIEFATSTPTATASKDSPAEPTSTPRVFQIATLPPTAQVAQTAPTPTATPVEEGDTIDFAASDWIGGFYQSDPELQDYYGRPWVAVYGAQSDYPQAMLAFELDAAPAAPVQITMLGLDDELEALNPIAIEINDRRVYEDEDIFANWNAVSGDPTVWSEVRLTIDPSLLEEGVNTLTLLNREPSASFNGPPYFLLGAGTIVTEDVGVVLASLDQSSVALQASNSSRGNSEDNRQDGDKEATKDAKEAAKDATKQAKEAEKEADQDEDEG
jgi:hypothetical protein